MPIASSPWGRASRRCVRKSCCQMGMAAASLMLALCAVQDTEPFPTRDVLAVLRVSELVFEHCSNCRSIYNSMEVRGAVLTRPSAHAWPLTHWRPPSSWQHLSTLLAAPDLSVVAATVQCVSMLFRRRNNFSNGIKPADKDLVVGTASSTRPDTGSRRLTAPFLTLRSPASSPLPCFGPAGRPPTWTWLASSLGGTCGRGRSGR